VTGGRLQYSYRAVRDRLLSDADGNNSSSVNFFGATPKVGAIWQITPTAQIYGNASRAYQPPLLLELTAPGQIPGNLNDLNPTTAWQFEVARGAAWARA